MSLCVHILQLVQDHSVLHWKLSLLVGLVMIMFIAPLKNRMRGYYRTGACHWEAQREQPRSTLNDVTTNKPNLTTRLPVGKNIFSSVGVVVLASWQSS